MKTIKFSYNWNNKLECKAFTTFLLHNTAKYVVGEQYKIDGKNVLPFIARCVEIRNLKLNQTNEFIARIDTGYSLEEFKKIIHRMYKDLADKNMFDFILLVKE